jgi:hypothetical protein
MATLYPAANGTLIRALLSDAEEAQYPTPPPGAGTPLVFDHTTNAALVADLHTSTDAYRLSAEGVLTKDGVAMTINPPALPPPPAVDPAAIGAALASLPDDQPLTKADLAPLLALFGAGADQT